MHEYYVLKDYQQSFPLIFFTLVYAELQMDDVGTLANNHSSRCNVRPSRYT